MPVAYVGAAAAIGSLALNVSNAGSGSGGGNVPQPYQPGNPVPSDIGLQSVMGQIQPYASALPGQVIPAYQTYAGNIQNNPFAAQQLQGAQTGANFGPQVGALQFGGAQNLAQGAQGVLQTGFDPQQALYAQLQNQTTQQANAANASAGVAGPYAAGTVDDSLRNFNIAWQNQQLGRQQSALAAAGTGFGRAGELGNAAIQTDAAAASLPYSTYLGQQQQNLNALGAQVAGTNAAFGPDLSLANLFQSYLGLGQSATGLAQAGQNQQFQQGQVVGGNIGQSLGALGGAFQNSSLFNSPPAQPLATAQPNSVSDFGAVPADQLLASANFSSGGGGGY